MLLNSVSKSVSESSGTKRVESSANLINSLLPDRVFKSSAHYQATYNAYTVRIHLELLSSAVSEQFNNGLSAAI